MTYIPKNNTAGPTQASDAQKELFDKALKYARLYAKDCEDLTEKELNDAVFEHLTKNKYAPQYNIESIVKKVVNIVMNPQPRQTRPNVQESGENQAARPVHSKNNSVPDTDNGRVQVKPTHIQSRRRRLSLTATVK